MTEYIIQKQLYSLFGNYDYKLFNTFIFAWESDFFAISKSGYSVECEVKISRSDFKADLKKTEKHLLLNSHKKPLVQHQRRVFEPRYHPWYLPGYVYNPDTHPYRDGDASSVYFCCPADRIPNKFYYAVPFGMISVDEVPLWAGLIYVKEGLEDYYMATDNTWGKRPSFSYIVVKQAPFLHKNIKDHKPDLLSKYYYKHFDIKNGVIDLLRAVKGNFTDYQKEMADKLMRKFY